MREPTSTDLTLREVVARVVPADAAVVVHAWSEPADMWFVEVTPRFNGAAAVSVAFDGEDLVSVTVGSTWFEMFPFGDPASVARLEVLLQAVVAGDLEEAGQAGRRFARIRTADGTVGVGHVHLPLPWSRRRSRRYRAYVG